MTSVAHTPATGWVGLGYVRRGVEVPATLRAGPDGPEVEVREPAWVTRQGRYGRRRRRVGPLRWPAAGSRRWPSRTRLRSPRRPSRSARPFRPTCRRRSSPAVPGATTTVPPADRPGRGVAQRHGAGPVRTGGRRHGRGRPPGRRPGRDAPRRPPPRTAAGPSAPSWAAATGSGPGSSPVWPSPRRRSSSSTAPRPCR